MEDEIDIRKYIETILEHWRWLIGIPLIAALLGLGLSYILPLQYEATSLIAIAPPRLNVQLETRLQTPSEEFQPSSRMLIDLAKSDELVAQLFDQLSPLPDGIENRADLSSMLNVETGNDPSIVRLRVRSPDPKFAARVANLWASLFVNQVNRVFEASNAVLQQLEQQLVSARDALDVTDKALIAFQARNQIGNLEAQLSSYRQQQEQYFTDQRFMNATIQNIDALYRQLSRQPNDQPASLVDELSVVFLQIKAFEAQANAPIQLQVSSGGTISSKRISDLLDTLEGMRESLDVKRLETEQRLVEIEPSILSLQAQLQESYTELDRLTRERDLAKETFTALNRKVEELRITIQSEEEFATARIASKALVPEKTVVSRFLIIMATGITSLLSTIAFLTIIEWQKNGSVRFSHNTC
ncbi:MAG: GumC family protein [Chloroflexus sp.]|uniref:GumC family protein n=1 Tax=Chloroflexus sp. TaxID=1904827 RepID=UPI00404AB8B2